MAAMDTTRVRTLGCSRDCVEFADIHAPPCGDSIVPALLLVLGLLLFFATSLAAGEGDKTASSSLPPAEACGP